MGYTTEFDGRFEFSKPLTVAQAEEFNLFCGERHGDNMKEFPGMPSFWCDWETDGTGMFWNGSEKSYAMDKWATILVEKFLMPWDVQIKGNIFAKGEDRKDTWFIKADGYTVKRFKAVVTPVEE